MAIRSTGDSNIIQGTSKARCCKDEGACPGREQVPGPALEWPAGGRRCCGKHVPGIYGFCLQLSHGCFLKVYIEADPKVEGRGGGSALERIATLFVDLVLCEGNVVRIRLIKAADVPAINKVTTPHPAPGFFSAKVILIAFAALFRTMPPRPAANLNDTHFASVRTRESTMKIPRLFYFYAVTMANVASEDSEHNWRLGPSASSSGTSGSAAND
ncbi:hypothetical protein K458DRAFT_427640 [Lentithecium fluviatile CBS 122367]|uniref:Uncharacterized protein n=1 Tax=Lentithecium fluviatile CBS 122367 TaxID=1168545 RepID=A0A6G1JFZ6_9PLEO|nr:hypothetical protein K458DRAFT_427640 [Lentithecium fluviatile CBS 122367]